ncbi:MAG: flavodoxin family protein, partial [Eubacteriales bacterium]
CEGCKDTFACVIKDDMQKIYPKILKADAIILGSPTYFYNISSKMKAFLERLYPYEIFDQDDRSVWLSLNEVTGIRYASVIAVCEQDDVRDMGFTAEAMSMPLQALGYRVVDTVKALHLFNKNDGATHPDIIKQAEDAGRKLAKTLILHASVKAKGL